jgi:hypothetical protein
MVTNCTYSNNQKPFSISLCDWKRRIWQGLEGGKEEREKAVRDEGNGQGKNHCKEECQFSHEREKIPYLTEAHVSTQAIIDGA